MSAPERIWANEGLEWHSFDCSDVKAGWTHPYILATPAALAASPEVAKLIREAEALMVAQAARLLDKRVEQLVADHGSYEPDTNVTNLPEWVETAVEELEPLAQAIRALAPADGLAAVDALRVEARENAMQALASMGQAQEAYEAQLEAEAELAATQQREAELRGALEMSRQGWRNALELDLLPKQHRHSAKTMADIADAALAPTPPADTWHERRTMLPDGDARKGEG